MKSLSIGQLSKQSGVKVTTIRYYESIGLIPEPTRSDSGRRLYGAKAVSTLSFVRHCRDLGFSMEAIENLLQIQTEPNQSCDTVELIARDQLAEVNKRIDQLMSLQKELNRIVQTCEGGHVGDCKIIAALSDHDQCVVSEHERLRSF